MIVGAIDKDHLAESNRGFDSLVGTQFELPSTMEGATLRFRLYDDDKELYYEGWFIDDADAEVQSHILDWGKWDSGCTTIMVKYGGRWVQVIG